jgi:hypothetical protein
MTWAPMHYFSAAMFFCFQIISNPGRETLRASVHRAIATLESCRGMRVAGRHSTYCARSAHSTVHRRVPLGQGQGPRAQEANGSARRAQTPVSLRRLSKVPIGAVKGAGSGNDALSPPA